MKPCKGRKERLGLITSPLSLMTYFGTGSRVTYYNYTTYTPISLLPLRSDLPLSRASAFRMSLLQADLEAAVAAVADRFGEEVVLFLECRVNDAAFC